MQLTSVKTSGETPSEPNYVRNKSATFFGFTLKQLQFESVQI
jgi:hypothetical protein